MNFIRRNTGTLLLGALGGAYLSILIISYTFFDELPRDVDFLSVFIEKITSSKQNLLWFWSIFSSVTLLGVVFSYTIALFRTFTETKKVLQEVREVNKVKDEFISMLLHYLRTPLSGMKWGLMEILKAPELSKPTEEGLRRVLLGGEQALDAVNHLVATSQANMGRVIYNFDIIDIKELYKEIKSTIDPMRSLADKKGITVDVHITPSEGRSLKVDREKINSVVQLLFENAIKYSASGSKIKIYSEETPSYFFFHVTDQGFGIPDQEKSKIFLPFFRGEQARRQETSGFGTGLFLIKTFLEAHGGSIWFESEEGKGTTFNFRLPLIKSQSEKYIEGL